MRNMPEGQMQNLSAHRPPTREQECSSSLGEEFIRSLSTHIGSEWESLGSHLGIRHVQIERLKLETTLTENRIAKMLLLWKNSQPSETGLNEVLFKALNKCGRGDLANRFLKIEATNTCVSQNFSEESLRILSSKIGHEWEKIGTFLGRRKDEIERLKLDHARIEDQIFNMLVKWTRDHNGVNLTDELCKALRKGDRRDLAQNLPEILSPESCTSSTSQKIDEVSLRDLSSKLGKEWEKIGTLLGFRKDEIERIKLDHAQTDDQIFNMLVNWAQDHPDVDLVDEFDKALRKSDRQDLAEHLQDLFPLKSSSTSDISNSNYSWVLEHQFGHEESNDGSGLQGAQSVAVNPTNGDIVVADWYSAQLKVFDDKGALKGELDTLRGLQTSKPSHPRDVAISSNGTYFVTNQSFYVKCFNASYAFINEFESSFIAAERSRLSGITFDNEGNLLVGEYKYKTISKHSVDGVQLDNFIADLSPRFLAVTPLDTIVISSWDPKKVEIWNMKGQCLHTLHPPKGVTRWRPTGVSCSKDVIFVANDDQSTPDEYGIYCYSLSGEYVGCATKAVTNPTGVAVTEDGNKLIVAQWERGNPMAGRGVHGVKVFKRERE